MRLALTTATGGEHRPLNERLQHDLDRAQRRFRSPSASDIDNLKQINDRYGIRPGQGSGPVAGGPPAPGGEGLQPGRAEFARLLPSRTSRGSFMRARSSSAWPRRRSIPESPEDVRRGRHVPQHGRAERLSASPTALSNVARSREEHGARLPPRRDRDRGAAPPRGRPEPAARLAPPRARPRSDARTPTRAALVHGGEWLPV